jgi:hypothetical protein
VLSKGCKRASRLFRHLRGWQKREQGFGNLEITVHESGCFLNSKLLLGSLGFVGAKKVIKKIDYYVLQYCNYGNAKAPTKTFFGTIMITLNNLG